MKILDIIKKVSKVIFYLSASFALIFGIITYRELGWIKLTTDGSSKAVECKMAVKDYQESNNLEDGDDYLSELNKLCAGISFRSLSLSVFDHMEDYKDN